MATEKDSERHAAERGNAGRRFLMEHGIDFQAMKVPSLPLNREQHVESGQSGAVRTARLRQVAVGDADSRSYSTLPGFIRFSGSSARLMVRISAISTEDL